MGKPMDHPGNDSSTNQSSQYIVKTPRDYARIPAVPFQFVLHNPYYFTMKNGS